uniref:Uncharacterized protein n=1 Tax=Setaria viridis TaxID=4556 RepID=A0A4U6U4N3_SETVI|nr:hypothetical protein SEVIR_6G019800v2 [Setaria viridis]
MVVIAIPTGKSVLGYTLLSAHHVLPLLGLRVDGVVGCLSATLWRNGEEYNAYICNCFSEESL